MQDCRHQLVSGRRPFFLLSGAYALWLLVVLAIFGYTPTNDGEGYLELARQCLAEGTPYPTTTVYQNEPFVWNIGIINLTELSLWLTGSIKPLLVLLCLMKAATALFLSLTAEKFFGCKAALAALFLFVFYPNNWGQSTMLSSEIPSTSLCVAAVYCLKSSTPKFLIVGLLLGLANWFRPTALIFMVAIAFFLFFSERRKAFRHVGVLIGGYALFVAVVGTSCLLRTGHFVYQARSYWFSMVDQCYDGAPVAPHYGQPVWPEGTPRYIENHEQMDCFEYERIWRERSLDWLADHKLDYLKKVPGRFFYMYQNDYDNLTAFLPEKSYPENNYITLPLRHFLTEASSMNATQWLAVFTLLIYIGVLCLGLAGAIVMVRRRQYGQLLPLFIVVGGTLALVLVMHGETRFKDPLMPFVFMLAGSIFSSFKQHKA